MRLVFNGASRGRRHMPGIDHHASQNKMWWNLGARAMKDQMLMDLTTWASTCPNPNTADDLWQFIEKAREINVDFDAHG
jgi:hypothetical protein